MKTLEQQLSRIDLNLLVSLSVLLQEKSVSRASEKLFLSQPAMSRTLKRLRDVFDDPLFYRESSGLQPTEKALSLQEPLLSILGDIHKLIDLTRFTPENCEQTFKISLPPLMSHLLAAPLAKALNKKAPKSSLIEYPASLEPTALLKTRDVDFSLHIQTPDKKEEFPSTHIGNTHAVIYGHKTHSLATYTNVTLEQCLAHNFVDYTLDSRSATRHTNPFDVYLEHLNKRRNIGFQSGQINTLIEAMIDTDTLLVSTHGLLTLPYVKENLVPILSLEACEELNVAIYLIEHKRTIDSPAHQWFKQLILETLSGQL